MKAIVIRPCRFHLSAYRHSCFEKFQPFYLERRKGCDHWSYRKREDHNRAIIAADVRQILGTITIDGCDIKEIELETLRKEISYVPQDVFLFSDTIANNIMFGVSDVSRDLIKQAAEYASIEKEIQDSVSSMKPW